MIVWLVVFVAVTVLVLIVVVAAQDELPREPPIGEEPP